MKILVIIFCLLTIFKCSCARVILQNGQIANELSRVRHRPSYPRWFGHSALQSQLPGDFPQDGAGRPKQIVLPNGRVAVLANGPSYRPAGRLGQKNVDKRSGQCPDQDWFVYWNNAGKCVKPLWNTDYNPTFCSYEKKALYCACQNEQTQGISKAVNTCIDKNLAKIIGRCSFKPCPYPYKCTETSPGVRYDCYNGNISVPTWY